MDIGRMLGLGQHEEYFPNGYGVSVIPDRFEGHFELAVLREEDGAWPICYDSEIGDRVQDYQTPAEIAVLIDRVKNLPKG